MKKNLTRFSIAAIFFILSACQKEIKPVGNTFNNKIKSYTEDITSVVNGHTVITYNLAYDANDRIINVVASTSPGDKFLFTYPSNTHYTMDLYNAGILSIHEDFFLTSNFFIDSTFQYNDTKDSSTEKYFYDGNNQLTKVKEYSYSTIANPLLTNTISYSYSIDGDLLTSTDTDRNTDTYEYYSNLSYVSPVVFGTLNSNSTKKNHLVKKHTLVSNGYAVGSADFTYTFDANDRISSEKALVSDGSIVIKSYNY